MASWHRRVRLGIGVFAVAFGGLVVFNMRERAQPAPPPALERLDPKATIETRGGDVIQLSGSRQDVRIEFGGQVTYEDGQSKLLDVKAYVDNRSGRSFVISGREGRVGKDQASIDITGDAVLETSDGLTAHAGEAHYVQAEGIIRAPGPVEFTRGRMTGSGVGFTYDDRRDTLWLLDKAEVHFAAEGDLTEMHVSTGAFGFARADRYMRFERGVRLVREGQTITSADGTAHLLPDRDEPDMIELRGGSSIAGGTGTGALQNMRARDMNLDYAEDGRTLQHVLLTGDGAIALANPDGSLGQELGGQHVDVRLAPDGTVTALTARDRARVRLPASGDAPSRLVTAPVLTGTGRPGQGLTAMHFEGGVAFEEAGADGGPPRRARATGLDIRLAPSTGLLEDARFAGGFRFDEGDTRASSAKAAYDVAGGRLALTGDEGGEPPRLEDARMIVKARDIDVTLSPRRVSASGTVRSEMLPAQRGESRGPSLLEADQAATIAADTLTFDEATGEGVYTGDARLWQGDTVIQAERITMNDREGDMRATGNVRSTLTFDASDAAPAAAPAPPTIARADEFVYEEAERRATYTKDAQMNGPEGNLHGDVIRLHLAPTGNVLDRIEATGAVTVLVDDREATGVTLAYRPADARYVMRGVPVTLLEGCRETRGQTLTFFRGSARIIVDGNEQQRTQTTGGGKCAEPRR